MPVQNSSFEGHTIGEEVLTSRGQKSVDVLRAKQVKTTYDQPVRFRVFESITQFNEHVAPQINTELVSGATKLQRKKKLEAIRVFDRSQTIAFGYSSWRGQLVDHSIDAGATGKPRSEIGRGKRQPR